MGKLTLILGPMKSGKSFDLISYFAPLAYSKIPHALYQPACNVRDTHISSRNGTTLRAKKIRSLKDIKKGRCKVIGIDESHMFDPDDIDAVRTLLKNKVEIVACGLDTDYRGTLFPIIAAFMSLGPDTVIFKKAACDLCRSPRAIYTQVSTSKGPVLDGLPSVLPDDGTYLYTSVCRNCFVRT